MYLDEIPLPSHRPQRSRGRHAWLAAPAAVIALVLVVAAGEFFGLLTPTGDPTTRAAFGEPVTVHLDAGVPQAVYVDSRSASDLRCGLTDHADVPISFERVLLPYALRAPGNDWYAVRWMRVRSEGTYEIQCEGTGTGYGIGPDARLTTFVDQRVFLFGVPGAAVAVAILVGVLLWRFRRDRLE